MKKKKEKTGKLSVKSRMAGVFVLILGIIFLPSAVLLLLGMLPAIVAAVMDRSKRGIRGLTVGAMNLAGCSPFLITLWTKGNHFDTAITIISDPRTIIVIYSAAISGYMIDWALTGLVAGIMVQRGQKRRLDIAKQQAALIQRWGQEVTGEIPLDVFGFPIIDAKTER